MKQQHFVLLGFIVVGVAVFWMLTAREAHVAAPAANPTAVAGNAAEAAAAPAVSAAPSSAAPSSAASVAPTPMPPAQAVAEAGAAVAAAAEAEAPIGAGEFGLFFTSNTMGELIDCGCRQNPLGGLARRVRWIRERAARYPAKLVVDTGGTLVADAAAVTETPEQLEARAEIYLAALEANAAAGLNVGAQELTLPPAKLQALATKHKVALLSANLRRGDAPAFQESLLLDVAGTKVGVFGLVTAKVPAADKWVAGQGLRIDDPVAAAARVAKELKAKGAKLIVAAAQLRQDEIDDIGEKVPDVDLILGSWEMDLTQRPNFLGRGFHLDAYNKGKWIGEVRVRPGVGDRWYVPDLRDKLSYEQGSLQRQIAYYTEQFAKDDAPGATKAMSDTERKFAEERMVMLRAKLGRVNLELQGGIDQPNGGAALLPELTAVKVELPEDEAIAALVAAHHKIWPPPANQH